MLNCDFAIKVLVIGEASVGKTCLLHRYRNNEFTDCTTPTIGSEYFKMEKQLDDTNMLIQIWDTAGQERYRAVSSSLYRLINGAIMVYDCTSRMSFFKLDYWYSQLIDNSPDKVHLLIIGNKTDLISQKEVSIEEVREWAKDKNSAVLEVSAKTNENNCVHKAFDEFFESIGNEIKSTIPKYEIPVPQPLPFLDPEPSPKSCC